MPKALHERYAVLYKTFADSWRVNDRTSLFVYAKGTSTVTFTDRGFPGESPPCKIKPGLENPGAAPLPGMSTLDARQVCQVVTDGEFFQNCVFDVATTGDKIFVESYLFAQELRRRATKVQVVAERPTTLPGEEFFVTAVTLPLRRRKTAPSGKVSFWVDNRRAGSAISLDAEGRARQKISGLGEGAHKIRAEFEPSNSEESLSCSSPNLLHQVRQKDDLHRPVYLRVVVEKIEVIDDRDCLGKGEVWFETCVETGYRGGTSVTKRLPSCGHFSVSDKPGKNVIELDTEIFRGVAADDLAIRIAGGEHDWLSENDPLGVYTRHFVGSAQSWLKTYRPDDESIDEEDVGLWKVTYRIEKVGG
jgi:hypothetical protein